MSFRIRTADVTALIAKQIREQAEAAGGGNTLISKKEQATVEPGPLATAIAEARAAEGKGARVSVDEAVEQAMRSAAERLGAVNQSSGRGQAFLSKAEVEALAAQDPTWGSAFRNAYDLLANEARAASDGDSVGSALPTAAAEKIAQQLYWADVIEQPDGFEVQNLRELPDGSHEFDWTGEGGAGHAWMKKIDGDWFIGPKPLSASDLHQATLGMRAYFDEHFADNMSQWASPHEIQAARDAIAPVRVLFAGEEDPGGLSQTYPLVFEMRNTTGSDHGFFVGYDPATGDRQGDAFN